MFTTRRFIGLMSGTSCDGVDAALIETTGSGLNMRVAFVDQCSIPYPDPLRQDLLAAMAPARTRTETIARLNFEVGRAFAQCGQRLMEQAAIRADQVTAIGAHGQTLCHMPATEGQATHCTLQIGESAVIAAHTGVDVIADFRVADMAAGGQGAPLVPWTDYVLFHDDQRDRIVQNIGGIANLTHLPAGEGPEAVIAFDTGPGCMIIDAMVQRLSSRHRFDPQGQYAKRGTAMPDMVQKIMQLPYFQTPPPKSAGREQFGRSFVEGLRQLMAELQVSQYDRLATATQLTATSIVQAYRDFLPAADGPREVILCGGGARNATLVGMLQQALPEVSLKTTDAFGIPLTAKESVSFAMLAAAFVDRIPANLPQVTGADRPMILGKRTPTPLLL